MYSFALLKGSAPAFSGRDFISGNIFGMFEKDIKFDLDDCLADDQVLSDLTMKMLEATKRGDWDSMKHYEVQVEDHAEALIEKSWDSCDQKVQDAFTAADKFYSDFMAKKDWKDIVEQNIRDNAVLIEQWTDQMVAAWFGNHFYEAGKLGGLIDQVMFAMPMPTYNTVNGDALVFTQLSGQDKWLLDTSVTHAEPAYPVKGTTAKFFVGGTWFMPETLVDVEFKVLMNGTALADLPEADAESVIPGQAWSKEFDFPIPGFAPSGTYDVTVAARDADKNHLWEVNTTFDL
jgi:hypothetical protein